VHALPEPLEPNDDQDDRRRAALAKVGTTLRGKWHLNDLIAVGGMGAVYDATHRNGMRGAVKVLDPRMGLSATSRGRFLREGRLANEVQHPGVVRVLDDDEAEDGTAYLVMELLTGSTLEALAADAGGKLEAAKAIEYCLQVVDTLAAAHASGIVHRDIKPENLFLTSDGLVKILDFGIAGERAPNGGAKLTMSGEIFGTPAFMSPEQARGRWDLVDHQSDLYSLGASLFTLLTGRLVHGSAGTVVEMLALSITCNPPSLAEAMPEAPDALVRAIDGVLKVDKSDRWANAETMRCALAEGYLALTGMPAPPPRAASPRERSVVTSTSGRAHRFIRTTLALGRLPSARWLVGLAVVGLASAAFASVVVPRGVDHSGKSEIAASSVVGDISSTPPTAPAPRSEPSARPVTLEAAPSSPSPVKVGRYDPLYDRRY
jgi:serine/threonine-protein kinase